MIEEDYVSFEVAKLLREKGFNEPCRSYYTDNVDYIDFSYCNDELTNLQMGVWETLRPTHQMAMKWLREIHKVVISIDAHTANHWDGYIDTFEIDILKNASRIIVPDKIAIHNTYEEAVKAALKYALENLI